MVMNLLSCTKLLYGSSNDNDYIEKITTVLKKNYKKNIDDMICFADNFKIICDR